VIVEIGNFHGGSLLAWAHLCDLLGHGRAIGVDIDHDFVHEKTRNHPRVTLMAGEACAVFDEVRREIRPDEKNVLVIEDSGHTYEGTLSILRTYASLVPPGGYFIVEDGICHHGLDTGPNPGPYEAIATFVAEHPESASDRDREPFGITWNPTGYLKRVETSQFRPN